MTILTDIADYPPHFWIERQEQYLICGSDRAVEQARACGHAPERIERVSGMILNPRFYEIEPLTPEQRQQSARGWASIRSCRSGWCCSEARVGRDGGDRATAARPRSCC